MAGPFNDPLEAEKIRRRRLVAQAMLDQSMQPLGPTEYAAGGMAVRRSPLEGLAKIAQGIVGGQEMKGADADAVSFRERNRRMVADALGGFDRATTARPAVPGALQEDAGGNAYRTDDQPAFTPSAGDRRAAAMRLAGDLGMGEEAAKAQLSEAFRQPKMERVDLGSEIGLLNEQGQIVQRIPKSATPDAVLRETGSDRRHATPSGSAVLGERGAAERHGLPSGSALLNAQTSIRGQDLVNQRAREANSIASGKRTDDATTDLRVEFNKLPEVKNYRSVVPIIESARRAPDTRAGDIELAYSVGKVLDPDSVVREGELKLVGQAATLMQRFEGELRTLTAGQGRLTPQTRAQLTQMLDGRVGALRQAHDAARLAYEGVARQRGLPTDQIFIELRDSGESVGRPRSREEILRQYGVGQ